MNIINKLTLRHLEQNKRRSLVTIFGVIISVAMITAVATLGVSFLDLMKRQHIATHGEWHVQYKDVNQDQIEVLENDSETHKLILSSDGYAALENSNNEYKPYLYFQNYNKIGMEKFPIKIDEGRLPNSPHEIAISAEIASNAKVDYKIGDELTLDIGKRFSPQYEIMLTQNATLEREEETITEELQINETKKLTIVGVIERPSWEPTWSPGYTVIGYVDEKSMSENETVNALVVSSKISRSIYEHGKKLAQVNEMQLGDFNSELLRYYGVTANDQLRMTLFSLASIIMSVIIVGSVALIYNAFGISVSERARHLGMLSSVGATKKQKRNSVFFEGAVIGAISLPIGIIAGLVGIGTTFAFINSFIENALGVSEKLELVVTPASILIACGISIVTIFISTYLPAQKASKISAIDAIRQTEDIKLSGKTVKTSSFVRKVFGLEAEIGLKNVKRNKKRYLATLFSLVISIVLFLSVSFFTDNLKKSLEMTQNNLNYDILISSSEVKKEVLAEFSNLEHVTKSTIIEESYFETFIDKDELPTLLKSQVEEDDSVLSDGKYPYSVTLHSLDQASFQEYVEQIGVNHEDFVQTDIPVAIIIDKISYEDGASGKFIETKSIETKVGNTIDLFTTPDWDMETEMEPPKPEYVNQVQIGALTDKVPMGVATALLGGINLIVSETTLAQFSIPEEKVTPYVYLNSTNPMTTQLEIEEIISPDIHVFNVYQFRQQGEQMILLMSVFTYGFIALISIISIANIFNTISTSISLRSREFAMLKSVGMTPKGFRKMINYESIFYGVNALAYGLPISVLVMFGIHRSAGYTFEYAFQLPWLSILFVIVMIFLIVGSAMLYSISKLKNKNIIESLKQENI